MAPARTAAQLKEYNRKRDFKKTAEPEGAIYSKKSKRLEFVVQKHEASHLHYDIRLEVDGVMKSWACPKGPSFDTSVKRLAVQVEDHPTSYNSFEGKIPHGQYGGGTVMVWDMGYYTVDDLGKGEDPEKKMREGLEKGKLAFTFHGKKLRGSFTLVRTRIAPGSSKPQWLLIKHRDDEADPSYDPVADEAVSAKTKRTMSEIETEGDVYGEKPKTKSKAKAKTSVASKKKIASSSEKEVYLKPRDRDRQTEVIRESIKAKRGIGRSTKNAISTALKPMLVHKTPELLEGTEYVYEQKLDGVRLIAYTDGDKWTVISRLGNDKSAQFPEIGESLKKLSKRAGGPIILDGEVVAIDKKGLPLGFQELQGRIHLDDREAVQAEIKATPVDFYIFDVLLVGEVSLLDEKMIDRREVLEKLFAKGKYPHLKINPIEKSAKKMKARAIKGDWEGLIIKDIHSPYLPGVRTKNWLKWKMVKREELIICGWTAPRGTRKHIGSLLLGYYSDDNKLIFAGHVGSGFNAKSLKEVVTALKELEQKTCPFEKKPATNEKPHWVKPELIAEVKFHEWTDEGNLRHGTFLGIRDDKRAKDIVLPEREIEEKDEKAVEKPEVKKKTASKKKVSKSLDLAAQMESIKEEGGKRGEGLLTLPKAELRVTHLDKIVFPKPKITKQDLLQYYSDMSEHILPWMKDRPLVMRRFPNGIESKDFYQQSPDDDTPGRVVTLKGDEGESQRRLIGGDLVTLLYLVQMGCISYDPWHSRVQSLNFPDYTIIDLDPIDGTKFETVRSVALSCLDFIEEKGLSAGIKTSGATGLHIYLPLPKKTNLETARLVAEIVCAKIAEEHKHGTIERMVKRRPKGSVYLDSQQNYLSKSVAGVFAVRARVGGTVSTPITRKELEAGVVPQDFHIRNTVKDAKKRAALWNTAMETPIDLSVLTSE
ncbi:MAG: DNA ligase D [Bdellovibrionota bacterium]